MCLFESVPPKQKQTIDLPERLRSAAPQRGGRSDVPSRRSEPGNCNFFPPETFSLAGEELSSGFKPGFVLPLKQSGEPARAREGAAGSVIPQLELH